ncbi:uncharacterized protein [Diadema setosum]|uniref:uncharacterized protein n=1 Tax=Diadema setosum TaxID=31175 RepID=UPI003B3BC214
MPCTRRRLDINNCALDQLTMVEGMTKPLARRILSLRNRLGNFSSLDELLAVHGIGEHLLEVISQHLYILPNSPRSSRPTSRMNSPTERRRRQPSHATSLSKSARQKSHFPSSRLSSPRRSSRPSRASSRASSRSRRSTWRSSRLSSPRRSARSSRAASRGKSPSRQVTLPRPPRQTAVRSPRKPYRNSHSSKKTLMGRTMFSDGPVYVDSRQNISIDLGKLAKDGCNLTLCGSGDLPAEGQPRPLLTINVKELDIPVTNQHVPPPNHSVTHHEPSPSPDRFTRNSSVVDEDIREYFVVRDTKRTTENFDDTRPTDESPRVSPPPESRMIEEEVEFDAGRPVSSRRSSPPPRPRTGSQSPSRQVKGRWSRQGREHLTRYDLENWVQEAQEHIKGSNDLKRPIASSTPSRQRGSRRSSPGRREFPDFSELDIESRVGPSTSRGGSTSRYERSPEKMDVRKRRKKFDGSPGKSEGLTRESPRYQNDSVDNLGDSHRGSFQRGHDESAGGPRQVNSGKRQDEAAADGRRVTRDLEETMYSTPHRHRHRHHTQRSSECTEPRRHRRRRRAVPETSSVTSWCSIM